MTDITKWPEACHETCGSYRRVWERCERLEMALKFLAITLRGDMTKETLAHIQAALEETK